MATSFNSVRKYRNGLDSIFGGMIDLLKVFTALFMIRQSQRKNSLSFFKQAATENVFIVNRPNFFGCHKNLFFFPRLSLSCFSGRQAAEGGRRQPVARSHALSFEKNNENYFACPLLLLLLLISWQRNKFWKKIYPAFFSQTTE